MCETGVNLIFQPLRKNGVVWPNYTLCRELACGPPPAVGPGEHIFVPHFLRPGCAGSGRRPGEHIFAPHFWRPDALEVPPSPVQHILARHCLRPSMLEVATGLGKHTFVRHLMHPDTLKVHGGAGEHIFARQICGAGGHRNGPASCALAIVNAS